jgi:hypothetical protein
VPKLPKLPKIAEIEKQDLPRICADERRSGTQHLAISHWQLALVF